ncbi:MAG TPA: hypothetical protein VHG91_17910 [Longimicrobium sp.]|nr:hypothetical protein [Longimicrobium sp.]
MLEELGADYQQNAQIGRFNVDFLVGTLVIECFGDFWHCNPAIWEPDDYNGSLHMRAGEKWAKDARRRQRLEEMGYRFHAFWESEIRDDRDTVRRVLAGIIGERS